MRCFETFRGSTCPIVLVSLLLLAIPSTPLIAQDEREPGWYDTAELSLIATGGNSESTTFGFRNLLERVWDGALLTVHAGGLRAETTATSRFAVGTPTSFRIDESSSDQLTAENYSVGARYDRQLSERLFWFASGDWQRNEFAGFDSRSSLAGGVGHTWWQTDDSHFRTLYGLTYTQQDDLVPNPALSDGYLGARASWDYLRQIGANTTYQNLLTLDPNLDETEDWRAAMIQSLSVSMTEKLALKVSLELLYDNLPSLVGLSLVDSAGEPTGLTVLGPLDELDSLFTVALVVSF